MTDTTDPTKPVAWTSKLQLKRVEEQSTEHLMMWGENLRYGGDVPLYDASLLSEYERVKAENAALAAHACIFLDGSGVTGDEHGNSICLVTRRSEALEAEVKRLCNLLNDTVVAWEALPGGQQSVKVVEKWLAEKMSAAINRIRAALEASR